MSFGRYLKAIRENRGISIEKLSTEICVPVRQLEIIEAEDFTEIPAEVYAKGILRAYAQAVGVDSEDIVQRFKTDSDTNAAARRREKEILASGKRNLIRMCMALGVLAIVMAITLYVAEQMNHVRDPADALITGRKTGQKETETSFSSIKIGNAGTENGVSAEGAIAPDSELQVLSVNAVSETIVSISVDGRDPTEYKLDPKDYLELAARNIFRISINDPASVTIGFNGESVDIKAGPGQQAKIVLPEETESKK